MALDPSLLEWRPVEDFHLPGEPVTWFAVRHTEAETFYGPRFGSEDEAQAWCTRENGGVTKEATGCDGRSSVLEEQNCRCQECGRAFHIRPAAKKRGQGKFCSSSCQTAYRSSESRFWENVEKSDEGCWLWAGYTDRHGYGYITIQTLRLAAHRLSYSLEHGSVPEGMNVLHQCDNPRCVRPDHLFLGTQSDNMADMNAKGRHGSSSAKSRGEGNAAAKLTEQEVAQIRADYRPWYTTKQQLATRYGVSKHTIAQIVNGRLWAHTLTDTERVRERETDEI